MEAKLEAELPKTTNPEWPDPSDWSKRLHTRLEEIGGEYSQLGWEVSDGESEEAAEGILKQVRAAEAVLAIAEALRELPSFDQSRGVAILHDIGGAFNDVTNGGNPRLFSSTRAGRRGSDGTDRNYVKIRVVFAVRVFIDELGWPQKKAVAKVTKAFANAGAKGRKGGPLAASTVQDWSDRIHAQASNQHERKMHSVVLRLLDELKAQGEWPPCERDLLDWVDRMARHPLLVSKYG